MGGEVPKRIVNVTRHFYEEQKRHPKATGDFSGLLSDLMLACKMISREVNKAGLIDLLGLTGETNVQGESVAKLDEYALNTIFKAMDHGGHLCAMVSEEVEDLMTIPAHYPKGKYVLIFDPLDGSSNIDANVSVGTIFSIHRRVTKDGDGQLEDCLQPGYKQVCAGYVIYGSSTMFVYTTGLGVHGFTLDPSVGEFLLSHPSIKIPQRGKIYSVNEGNAKTWDEPTHKYIAYLKEYDPATKRPYSARYIGSLVSDFHRNLLYGGIFLYPADRKNPAGKLRLLYEAAPMAFIVEQAGGSATTGKQRILDIQPEKLHQRVPLIIGSPLDVKDYEGFCHNDRGTTA